MFCLLDRIISYLLRLECNFIQYKILSSIVLIIIWRVEPERWHRTKWILMCSICNLNRKDLEISFAHVLNTAHQTSELCPIYLLLFLQIAWRQQTPVFCRPPAFPVFKSSTFLSRFFFHHLLKSFKMSPAWNGVRGGFKAFREIPLSPTARSHSRGKAQAAGTCLLCILTATEFRGLCPGMRRGKKKVSHVAQCPLTLSTFHRERTKGA